MARSFEDLREAVRNGMNGNDAALLLDTASAFDTLGTTESKAQAAYARGWGLFLTDDVDGAIEQCTIAIDLFTESGNGRGAASATVNLGSIFSACGDNPSALLNFRQALATFIEIGFTHGEAHATGDIGTVFCSVGDYPTALEHYHRAYDLFEKAEGPHGMGIMIMNMANVYEAIGDTTIALSHAKRAHDIYHELDYPYGIATALSTMGVCYERAGDLRSSLEHHKEARDIHLRLGSPSRAAHSAGNVIEVLIDLQELEEARTQLSATDFEHDPDPEVFSKGEILRARIALIDGDIDTATTSYQLALASAVTTDNLEKQARIHKELRDLCQQTNNFADYIAHNDEYDRITSSMRGAEVQRRLAVQERQRELDAKSREHEKHMAVLHSTLPRHVAERVARGEVVNDHFENASVIFMDIVGFTTLSSLLSSQEVITMLDDVFTQCDEICAKHNVTKIKTIGDCYMCVSFDSVIDAACCAMEMVKIESRINNQESNQGMLQFRIGIHCGPVTAGVIGKERLQYDVWGDTVNVASRMESSGEAGRIHVSQAFVMNLKSNTEYRIQNSMSESQNTESHEVPLVTSHSSLVTFLRGSFDIKGKGKMMTYWLESLPPFQETKAPAFTPGA